MSKLIAHYSILGKYFFLLYNTIEYFCFSDSKNNGADGNMLNVDETNCTKEDNSDSLIQPSECKILKTVVENEVTNELTPSNQEDLDIKVIFNKKKYDVKVSSNLTISDFKKQLQSLLGMIKIDLFPFKVI